MTTAFDCFVGIDWSGNKKKWQDGLRIALAGSGSTAPLLVPGPGPKCRWSRKEAASWLVRLVKERRALIGLDFAFGFPPIEGTRCTRKLDWKCVDEFCRCDENFYGGRFFQATDAPHSCLTNRRGHQGADYDPKRLRTTERAAARVPGATPQSVFNAIGPAQVGMSSISGMRVLRRVKEENSDHLSIWPFDEIDAKRSLIVEIFPRYFPLTKGVSPKLKDHAALNEALSRFGSATVKTAPKSEDEGDALLSAAALRSLSSNKDMFVMPDVSIRSEGWIFGVPFGDAP